MLKDFLVGIIPLNVYPFDFRTPWHDCLIPIAPNYLAIERAVLECATMGCKNIYIVCPKDIEPLIKSVIGEKISDPVTFASKKYVKMKKTLDVPIPIYYVPVQPKDQGRKDGIVNSILYGCLTAQKIGIFVSRHLVPQKYYICFPNVLWPSRFLLRHRIKLAQSRRFVVSYKDQTLMNSSLHLPMTINDDDLDFLVKKFRSKATGKYMRSNVPVIGDIYQKAKRPPEERWSGRWMTTFEIFQELEDVPDTFVFEANWAHQLESWDGYLKYMKSGIPNILKRPQKRFFTKEGYWTGRNDDEKNMED